MLKKRLLAFLIAGMLLLSLTACDGDVKVDVTINPTTTAGGDDTVTTTVAGDNTDSTTVADNKTDSTTTAGGNNNNNNNNNNNKTTTSTKKVDSTNDGTIKRNVTIKKGTTKIETGLNLGGKTVKYAIGLPLSDRMKGQIAAFQNKYNCKVETELLGFTDYVQNLSAKVAGGTKYDILQVEGLRFPSIVIANFCEPLENVISTADWGGKELSKGGFSEDLTQNFAWNNHLYAVVGVRGEFAPNMQIVYYNKRILKQAGAEDPRDLYDKNGYWTFDDMYRIGTQVRKGTNNSVYLANVAFTRNVPKWNNAPNIDFSDYTKPKANLTSQATINAYKFTQKMTTGNNAVVGMENLGDHTPQSFFEGKVALWTGFWFDLFENSSIGKGVSESNAFAKKVSNLGMGPHPIGPDNKEKADQVGSWLYGIGAGVGTSDPRIAMAFAKFSATYPVVNTTAYKWSAKDQAIIDQLTLGPKVVQFATFSDGSNDANTLVNAMQWSIFEGGDVAQLTSSYNAQVQNCIDVMISQQ